jgi:phage gp29-like protein
MDNWQGKLANPARVAVAPQSAAEEHKQSFFRQIMAWGVNTVFGMTPGYDVKLLESNGRGWESFLKTIEQCNTEYIVCIAGQTVTTDGGAGFQNSDIHKSIRADLIKATADGLAYTINTQALPAFIVTRWGEAALSRAAVMWWDVTPSKDRAQEANSLQVVGQAIAQLRDALAAYGRELDIDALCARFGVPIAGDRDGDGSPEQAPEVRAIRPVESPAPEKEAA